MKNYPILMLLACLMLSPFCQAKITCSKAKISKPVNHNSLFHFKALVTCDMVDETINLAGLKDAYLKEIVQKGSQFKVHKQLAYDDKQGMTGYAVDATQSYDTPHGRMAVRANIIIADNKAQNFYYELRSKSIDAEDDAQYDKTILNICQLQLGPNNNANLTISKEIDVEEPWYAPDEMFFDKVIPELREAINKAALDNARKMCGQKVEALRK